MQGKTKWLLCYRNVSLKFVLTAFLHISKNFHLKYHSKFVHSGWKAAFVPEPCITTVWISFPRWTVWNMWPLLPLLPIMCVLFYKVKSDFNFLEETWKNTHCRSEAWSLVFFFLTVTLTLFSWAWVLPTILSQVYLRSSHNKVFPQHRIIES